MVAAFTWFYASGTDYLPFSDECSHELEKLYTEWQQRNFDSQGRHVEVRSGEFIYTVDFQQMSQQNARTGKQRPVKREACASDRRVAELVQQLQAAEHSLETAQQQLQEARLQLAEEVAAKNSCNEILAQLREELLQLTSKHSQLEEQHANMQRTNEKLTAQSEQLQEGAEQRLDTAKQQMECTQQQLAEEASSQNGPKDALTQLQDDTCERTSEIKLRGHTTMTSFFPFALLSFCARRANAKLQPEMASAEVPDTPPRVCKPVQAANAQLDAELEMVQQEVAELLEQNAATQSANEQMLLQIESKKTTLESEMALVDERLAKMQTAQSKLQQDHAELSNDHAKLKCQEASMQRRNEELLAQNSQLSLGLAAAKREFKWLQDEKSQLLAAQCFDEQNQALALQLREMQAKAFLRSSGIAAFLQEVDLCAIKEKLCHLPDARAMLGPGLGDPRTSYFLEHVRITARLSPALLTLMGDLPPERPDMASLEAVEGKGLASDSLDFKLLSHMFVSSLVEHRLNHLSSEWCSKAEIEILSIAPVTVPAGLYRWYRERCERLEKQADPFEPAFGDLQVWRPQTSKDGAKEFFMFHGTSWSNVHSICKSGFDAGQAGRSAGAAFGRGAYFAPNASKSDQYARKDAEGRKCMLMVRVALGRCMPTWEPCPSWTQPPAEFNSVSGVPKKFGGCVDHPEVAVFEAASALPCFKYIYKHKATCRCYLCRREAGES